MVWLFVLFVVVVVGAVILVSSVSSRNNDSRQQATAQALVHLVNTSTASSVFANWGIFVNEFERRYSELAPHDRKSRLIHALSMVRTALHPDDYREVVALARSYDGGAEAIDRAEPPGEDSLPLGGGMPIYSLANVDQAAANVSERALSQDRFTVLSETDEAWLLRVEEPEGRWEVTVKLQTTTGLGPALMITKIIPAS